jgi:RimJ/RimL family protein N-acetyltransferase
MRGSPPIRRRDDTIVAMDANQSLALTPVELTDGVVGLRPWRTEDAEAVYLACQDADIQRWTRVPSPYRRDDARWFVGASAQAWAEGRAAFAVVDAATDEVVGSHGFVTAPDEGVAEIGYWTAPWGRGRGLTTAATRLVARWAFETLGLARLDWYAEVGNIGSRRVAESAGFRFEGTLPGKLQQRGRQVDAWVAGLLPADLDAPRPQRRVPWEPQVVFGDGVVLREFADDDLKALRVALDDPQTQLWNPVHWAGPDRARSVLQHGRDWSSGTFTGWLICTPERHELQGLVAVHSISQFHRTGEVGYWVAAPERGKGLATAALRTASDWAFRTLDLRRLDLAHAVENVASCRVAEKSGFVLEGTHRLAFVYGDGQPHDEHRHARLATVAQPGGGAGG